MAYYFYLDKVLLPVAPGELTMTINNQNKTMNMINEGEINLLKSAGLTDISLEVLLPQVNYPFAYYKSGFQRAAHFLNKFESLKVKKEPFQFIVTRTLPNGKLLFDTNMKVSMEDYEIKENNEEGFDVIVSINLKQYKDFGTKKAKIKLNAAKAKPKVTVSKNRSTESSPKPKKTSKNYTVKKGDCLWNICKKFYGKGNWTLVNKVVAANKGKIKNPNLIYPGQVFTIPPI